MKHAFITGASSGIGAVLAQELARRGFAVTLAARRLELLEANAAAIRNQGGSALALRCDVTDAGSVRAAVERAASELGPVDLAVANAGIGIPTRAYRFVLSDAEAVMRTNFFGMLHLFDAVIPPMVERRAGRFVGIASLAGLRGVPYASMYSTSKAAMQTFLEASRIELKRFGVAVTIVNPGFIATPLTDRNRIRMPFVMSVDRAGRIIADGIVRGKRTVEFPLPMSVAVRLMRLLPSPLYDWVVAPHGKRTVDVQKGKR